MGRALRVWDPFGFPLEFFHEIDAARDAAAALRPAPRRAGDALRPLQPSHAAGRGRRSRFWRELGFRCSEYISTDGADERLTGAWLLRKPTVHDVALTVGRGPRLHHLGFCGRRAGRRAARLRSAGGGRALATSIERGPGRHGVSNAFFVYLRDPDGHRIELYACDYYTGDPDHEPLRWSVSDPRCRSFWGTRAPDSWYDESSVRARAGREPRAETDGRRRRRARRPHRGHGLAMALPDGLQPTKIIAVHLNYRSRAEQRGRTPSVPSYFLKPPSSLAGDGDAVVRPRGTELLAFEGEIAVDRSARGRATSRPRTGSRTIGWFAPANDFGALRPALGRPRLEPARQGTGRVHPDRRPRSPADDVDPDALTLRTRVNGEVVQEDVEREPDLPVRPPGRRPLALHHARARRRDPDRHARRLAAGRAGRRGRGRARGRRRASATPSSRPTRRSPPSARSRRSTPDAAPRRSAAPAPRPARLVRGARRRCARSRPRR